MDEAPELDGDSTASFAENGTGPVATYTATDPEEKDIRWSLTTGGDADDFTIVGGVLRFGSPPNFEIDQGTGSGDNEYVVTVEASAGASDTADIQTETHEVTVTVTDEEEPGSVMAFDAAAAGWGASNRYANRWRHHYRKYSQLAVAPGKHPDQRVGILRSGDGHLHPCRWGRGQSSTGKGDLR